MYSWKSKSDWCSPFRLIIACRAAELGASDKRHTADLGDWPSGMNPVRHGESHFLVSAKPTQQLSIRLVAAGAEYGGCDMV